MALKRALVVDDSKSARLVLRRLLEKYNLTVDTAESAEEALEFLVEQQVDVIFMDHTMPGMDGLQAVSALKNNPRTAIIPVMMYTAKEGEVYVGQARALGAVGVLPKQVHPAELFKVLQGLGLVTDRRAKPRKVSSDVAADPADLDNQIQGVALQALVERLLQEQRNELRYDILSSHKEFAEHVADEIYRKQSAIMPDPEQLIEPITQSQKRWRAIALVLALPLLFLLVSHFYNAQENAALREENALLSQWQNDASVESSSLTAELSREQQQSDVTRQVLISALESSINRNNSVPFDEPSMNDEWQESLSDLLSRLVEAEFIGVLRLESHLGEFCLVGSDSSSLQIADPDIPLVDCNYVGHPLDDSVSIAERQSINFANFLSGSSLVNGSGIVVEIIAHARSGSVPRYPYPDNITSAGEWNRIAALNHRLEVTLLPDAL